MRIIEQKEFQINIKNEISNGSNTSIFNLTSIASQIDSFILLSDEKI